MCKYLHVNLEIRIVRVAGTRIEESSGFPSKIISPPCTQGKIRSFAVFCLLDANEQLERKRYLLQKYEKYSKTNGFHHFFYRKNLKCT